MKKILVLGAGLVARPLVQYLLKVPFQVVVATRTISKAYELIENNPNGRAIALDINKEESLKELVKEADLTISLLPYIHHVKVANLCIEYKKSMVTTSYVSDDMRKLDSNAKSSGVIILNEIGLDPGIDHISAMKIIHSVQNKGGEIVSFRSYCGGLPAPESNDNPFGYKFSWSPKGVVLAAKNNARYLKDGKVTSISSKELFNDYSIIEIEGSGKFESYPNRDSIPYIQTYGISSVRNMFRGTLRNPGWCILWKKIGDLGFLDDEERNVDGLTYKEFIGNLINADKTGDVKKSVASLLNISTDSEVIKKMEWLGLFSDERIAAKNISPIDLLVSLLSGKLWYKKGERDMVVLYHDFDFIYPAENKKEKITSTLIDFGIPNGDSAMSRTVGLPAAIGTKLILEDKIKKTGVHIPIEPEIYEPVLKELEKQGIVCKEKVYAG